jgi:Zn-dependent peptidase ImmA (M78 family)
MPLGTGRMIIEHDGHDEVRRRASIAHELGHHMLEHPFDAALTRSPASGHCRTEPAAQPLG